LLVDLCVGSDRGVTLDITCFSHY